MVKRQHLYFPVCVALAAGLALPALAHIEGEGLQGGFMSGYVHPLFGWDHVAAMVAVGIWGAFLGDRAVWSLPLLFPFIMVVGGILGMTGVNIPLVVPGIALSSIIIGAAIMAKWRAPLWIAALLVGIFAIFHGHAHGENLPDASNPVAFAVGFVLGSGTLHLIGILFSFVDRYKWGTPALQIGGGVIIAVGAAVLLGWL